MQESLFATIGDNCIDRFLPPVNDCLIGGNAVNLAVQLARLGRHVSYFGAVGSDGEGLAVRDALAANGVDLGGIRRLPGAVTARTDIEILPGGDRRFVSESFGACSNYRPGPDDIARLKSMRHIHIGWFCGAADLREALRGSGVVVSQDLSVNNSAEELDPAGLDIAFSSADPADGESESVRLLARGARLAVVTLGASGSLANAFGKLLRVEAAPTEVADTTGAGDAFIAGFLDAFAKRLNLKDCLLSGGFAGAAACCYRGGFPQPPLQPFVHDVGWGSERVLEPD